MPRSALIIVGLIAFVLASAHSASARVSWKANPETDIAGYRLQWSAPNPAL